MPMSPPAKTTIKKTTSKRAARHTREVVRPDRARDVPNLFHRLQARLREPRRSVDETEIELRVQIVRERSANDRELSERR
jgi:hypothetical protein